MRVDFFMSLSFVELYVLFIFAIILGLRLTIHFHFVIPRISISVFQGTLFLSFRGATLLSFRAFSFVIPRIPILSFRGAKRRGNLRPERSITALQATWESTTREEYYGTTSDVGISCAYSFRLPQPYGLRNDNVVRLPRYARNDMQGVIRTFPFCHSEERSDVGISCAYSFRLPQPCGLRNDNVVRLPRYARNDNMDISRRSLSYVIPRNHSFCHSLHSLLSFRGAKRRGNLIVLNDNVERIIFYILQYIYNSDKVFIGFF